MINSRVSKQVLKKNRTSNITCSCIEAAWVSHCSKHGNIFVTLSLSYENKRCLNKNNVISTAAHVAVVEVLMKCAGKLFSQEIVLNNLFISSSWFIWNHYQNSTLPRIYTNCEVLYFGIDRNWISKISLCGDYQFPLPIK